MGRPSKGERRSQVASTTLHPVFKAEVLKFCEEHDIKEAAVIRLCIQEAWPKIKIMVLAQQMAPKQDDDEGRCCSAPAFARAA